MLKFSLAAAVALLSASAMAQTVAQNTNGPAASSSTEKVTLGGTDEKKGFFSGMKLGSPIAYPGGVWGTLVYSAKAPDGYLKYRVEGVVDQGVDWFRFSDGSWKFNTYAGFEYVLNSESNGVTPMLGAKINKRFTDGSLDLGLRVKHGNTYLSPTGGSVGGTEKVTRVEAYATYWFGWDLKGQ